jgi:hypothetical protein
MKPFVSARSINRVNAGVIFRQPLYGMSRPCEVVVSAHTSAREQKPAPLWAICAIVFKGSRVERARRSRHLTVAEESDPRVQPDKIPFDTPVPTEPVIVLPYDGRRILIEGHLRSLLFMRNRDPHARIMVWVPAIS